MGFSAISIPGIVIFILMAIVLFFAVKRIVNKWFKKN